MSICYESVNSVFISFSRKNDTTITSQFRAEKGWVLSTNWLWSAFVHHVGLQLRAAHISDLVRWGKIQIPIKMESVVKYKILWYLLIRGCNLLLLISRVFYGLWAKWTRKQDGSETYLTAAASCICFRWSIRLRIYWLMMSVARQPEQPPSKLPSVFELHLEVVLKKICGKKICRGENYQCHSRTTPCRNVDYVAWIHYMFDVKLTM